MHAAASTSNGDVPALERASSSITVSEDGFQRDSQGNIVCPYLDTINRKVLDFDFARVCSVTLSPLSVYCCLCCGVYFQGRGKHTPAYRHAVDSDHHVFINLHTTAIYCLPDGYQIHDPSLADIQFNIAPHYDKDMLTRIEQAGTHMQRAQDGSEYMIGLMGLNNMNDNDWLNATIQCLYRCGTLRRYLLTHSHTQSSNQSNNNNNNKTSITTAATTPTAAALTANVPSSASPSKLFPHFVELCCKLNNPYAFKGHVTPQSLLEAVSLASDRQFSSGIQSDPITFLSFFLNRLHKELGGSKTFGGKQTIISQCFQGAVRIHTTKQRPLTQKDDVLEPKKKHKGSKRKREENGDEKENSERPSIAATTRMDDDNDGSDMDDDDSRPAQNSTSDSINSTVSSSPIVTETISPFFFLSLRLPPAPLFRDSQLRTIIPQVPLIDLLQKFTGQTEETNAVAGTSTHYRLQRLPPYLIIHYQRFQKNQWGNEKNNTLVNFPMIGLEMKPYLEETPAAGKTLHSTRYNLIANLIHESLDQANATTGSVTAAAGTSTGHSGSAPDATAGTYRAQILHAPNQTWYEVQDLRVSTSETMAQMVGLSEAYIQIYERQRDASK